MLINLTNRNNKKIKNERLYISGGLLLYVKEYDDSIDDFHERRKNWSN